jgi:hypothetical protein
MAVCQFCGIDSPGDSRFCGVCGRPLTSEHDASTSRSSTNSPLPPPPPPPILQRSSVPSPYPQGNGPSFIAPVAPVTPSMSQNAPPPPSGALSQPPPPPTIRQSFPGQASGPGQQPPTIRQSFPGQTSGLGQQPPTIRQSFPDAAGTPPSTTPVNNQSPMFLPATNSGVSYNTPNLGNSSQYDGGNQKLQQKKRSSGLRLLTFAILLVIVLIGGVGSVLAYEYFHNKPASNSTAVATATPAPTAAATLAPTPTATPTASASATPAATLTPTVAATAPTQTGIVPQSPALPLTIPCVNCSYPKLTLVLSNITPDQANPSQTTDWNFTITNSGSSSCSSVNFNQMQLEDPSTTYQGQGQAGDTWTMNLGQQQIESPSFQVVPNPGVRYTLNVSININNCNDGTSTTNTYQTESLTF